VATTTRVETPTQPDAASRRRLVRWVQQVGLLRGLALLGWASAVVAFTVVRGLPVDRTTQTLAWVGLLLAADVGSTWAHKGRVLLDWLPFVGFLYLYDYTRGLASWFGAPVHVELAPRLDRALAGGHLPTVVLQDRFYDPGRVHWWDTAAAFVYSSHFFVAWSIAVVLYLRSRAEWARWVRRLLVLSYGCLLAFVVFPAAPPWWAAKHGAIEPVARISGRGFEALHLHIASALLQRGQAASNNVAALPSLHAAIPLLITVFFWARLRWSGRLLLSAYTAAMGLVLVYSGEHYVADLLAGYAFVGLTVLAVAAWERRGTEVRR
jgi:hypothetical protein